VFIFIILIHPLSASSIFGQQRHRNKLSLEDPAHSELRQEVRHQAGKLNGTSRESTPVTPSLPASHVAQKSVPKLVQAECQLVNMASPTPLQLLKLKRSVPLAKTHAFSLLFLPSRRFPAPHIMSPRSKKMNRLRLSWTRIACWRNSGTKIRINSPKTKGMKRRSIISMDTFLVRKNSRCCLRSCRKNALITSSNTNFTRSADLRTCLALWHRRVAGYRRDAFISWSRNINEPPSSNATLIPCADESILPLHHY